MRRPHVTETLPPGPRRPALGQTLWWVLRPEALMAACRTRFGDRFTITLAGVGQFVFLSDPGDVRTVMTAPELRAGEANRMLEPILGSRSVLLLDGPEHLRERRLLLPTFHGDRLAGWESLIREIAREHIARWPRGEAIALQDRLAAITLDAILHVVFGLRDGPRLAATRAAIVDLLATSANPAAMIAYLRRNLGPGSPWRRFVRARDHVDELLLAEIADRRATPDLETREDVLSLLLLARDESGTGLSDRELRDELITLLIAGHETTATGLAWAAERVARTPRALAGLREDGDPYATAVVREILRLRPPVPIVARLTTAPYELPGGPVVPAGVRLCPCAWLVHRRADLYPDPLRFDPDRFMTTKPGTYTWLPFGGGTRRCVGASFAELEMRVVLQELVRAAAIAPAGEPEGTRRRAIIFAPARGGEVVLSGS